MKKAKILAVFGILLAMGITACNKENGDAQSQETPVTSEQQGGGETSAHTHKFGSWTVVEGKEPTCTEKGQEQRVCECGEKEFRDKAALGHDFKNGTVTADTSTCTADGKQTIKCARCDVTQEVNVKAHHRFGEEAAVAAKGDGYVGYKKAECSVDHALQFKIRALDGTLASGSSIKSGTAEGYFKLNTNGHSMSWKFDYQPSSGKTGAIGMIYTRGFMDAWSSNSSKKYGVYSTSSQDTRDAGNFDFTVNGNLVDKKAYMQKTFEELTAGGEDSSSVGDNYSPIALIPVGEVVLNKGDNTFVYKRTGSYNFVISDLVFIGSEFAHEHTAGTAWESDETNHWHVCTAPGCPVESGYKMDNAAHTFGEKYDEVAATCSAKGSYKQKCTVCDYVKTVETDKIAHTYPNDGAYTKVDDPTCDTEGHEERECSVCHEKDVKIIPALGHNFGEVVANYAAVTEGENQHIAATAHNCANCDKSALQWSALDYDEAKTTAASDKAPKSADNGNAVQFDTSVTQGMGDDHSGKGTHLIYVVNVPEAVENAKLAMLISKTPYTDEVFDARDQENSKGYKQNDAGEWVRPDSRYGVKVDGVEYMVAKNNGAIKNVDGNAWYQFPGISLTLTAGIHEFEFFKYGGYDVNNYAYRLMGLSHITPTHSHNGDAEWKTDETNHWHVCTGEGCPIPEADAGVYGKEAHTFGAKYDEVAATCTSAGSYKEKCSVCNYVKETVVPKLAHAYGTESVEDYGAVTEGENKHIAASAYNCSTCETSALRWAALDFDTTLSTSGIEKNSDNVRFKSGSVENKGGTAGTGSHLVYKVNVNAAIAKAGLAFKIKNTGGASGVAPVFKTISGDSSLGAIANGDGTFTTATHRYGLKVNGVEYLLGDDSYGNQSGVTGWFEWPVEFPLEAGVNTIDIFAYAGYRANMYEFQFIGLPHVTPSHVHTLSENYSFDDVNHWKTCTAADCPASGVHLKEAKHEWTVGGAAGDAQRPVSCACGGSGIQFDGFTGDNASAIDGDNKVTKNFEFKWNVNMPKAGKVALYMSLAYSQHNGGQKFGTGYALKCGENTGTISIGDVAFNTLLQQDPTRTYIKIGEVDVASGEVLVEFTFGNPGTRIISDKDVRLIYVA